MQKYQPLQNSEVIKIAESFYAIEKDDITLEDANKPFKSLNKKHSGLIVQRKIQKPVKKIMTSKFSASNNPSRIGLTRD